MNARIHIPALLAVLAIPLFAQQNLESEYRTTGPAVVAAFDEQRAVLQTSSAVIYNDRRQVNYGVVISSDGHILTKASEIAGLENLTVTVDRTHFDEVEVLAIDPVWDVALLKIDAQGLLPVEFAPSSALPHGSWVVANGATSRIRRRALAGIVSANSREVPATGGPALGLVIRHENEMVEIGEVVEGGGAAEAGLREGDVILSIDGHPVSKIEDIAEALEDRKAGDVVEVRCRRGDEEVTAEVLLAAKGEMFLDSVTRNDMMSGDFSRRRSGFPRVIQHDILGNSEVTGGPLLDLEGRCVGMNIARANRAESFAIPVEELRELADRLMREAAGSAAEPNER